MTPQQRATLYLVREMGGKCTVRQMAELTGTVRRKAQDRLCSVPPRTLEMWQVGRAGVWWLTPYGRQLLALEQHEAP